MELTQFNQKCTHIILSLNNLYIFKFKQLTTNFMKVDNRQKQQRHKNLKTYKYNENVPLCQVIQDAIQIDRTQIFSLYQQNFFSSDHQQHRNSQALRQELLISKENVQNTNKINPEQAMFLIQCKKTIQTLVSQLNNNKQQYQKLQQDNSKKQLLIQSLIIQKKYLAKKYEAIEQSSKQNSVLYTNTTQKKMPFKAETNQSGSQTQTYIFTRPLFSQNKKRREFCQMHQYQIQQKNKKISQLTLQFNQLNKKYYQNLIKINEASSKVNQLKSRRHVFAEQKQAKLIQHNNLYDQNSSVLFVKIGNQQSAQKNIDSQFQQNIKIDFNQRRNQIIQKTIRKKNYIIQNASNNQSKTAQKVVHTFQTRQQVYGINLKKKYNEDQTQIQMKHYKPLKFNQNCNQKESLTKHKIEETSNYLNNGVCINWNLVDNSFSRLSHYLQKLNTLTQYDSE